MIDYIVGQELVAIIKSDKVPQKDYLVIDVRDSDWAGGNIKNSHNSPFREFSANVDRLVQDTKDIPTLIFHCAYSEVRGPKAAWIYQEARKRILNDPNDRPSKILVLSGGFAGFQTKYKDDPELVENWDPENWVEDWNI